MKTPLGDALTKRFLRYIKINTQSDESSKNIPSTQGQMELANMLKSELKGLGLKDIELDGKGYLMASLPANTNNLLPVIGFLAHLDTSPEVSGKDIQARIHENYKGGDIFIDPEGELILNPSKFPELNYYKGHDIITANGKTLLGADDKAGIAEIITAVEYLINHPEIPHGKIRIGFTPDEEIGRGTDHFDVKKFGADFAYTLDGAGIGELEYENFNAAKATVTINGFNAHPGGAKNSMINAINLAHEFHSMLPYHDRPEHTEGYEGFFHLTKFEGTIEHATLHYIIRDHDKMKFTERKQLMGKIAGYLNAKYEKERISLQMEDQYYNMRNQIEPVMHVVDRAKKALKEAGIRPGIQAIRGGTDGARLSYMGLPCPNIFAGGHNFHSRYEYIPVQSMIKAVEVILNIVKQ